MVLYKNVRLEGLKASRCIYTPGIILEVNESKNNCSIQSIITNRIVKYNFSFLKKVTKPIFYKLPSSWKGPILEAVRKPGAISSQETDEGELSEDVSIDEVVSDDESLSDSQTGA